MATQNNTETNPDLQSPAIYVGTYAKYNEGSLFGQWMNPADYSDCAEFYEACRELHKGEHDPEFMFQDWENIPDEYISESGIGQDFWDYLDLIEASHLDPDVFEAAADCGIPAADVEEAYQGTYKDDQDFAYQLADDLGAIDHDAGWPMNCIDWERAARDLMFDYCESNGHYFRNL